MSASALKHGGMDARSPERHKAPPKEIRHLEMKEAENGGHIVTHVHTHYEHEPEMHAFSESAHKVKLPKGHVLAHIAKHMKIPHAVEEAAEEKIHPGIHEKVAEMVEENDE